MCFLFNILNTHNFCYNTCPLYCLGFINHLHCRSIYYVIIPLCTLKLLIFTLKGIRFIYNIYTRIILIERRSFQLMRYSYFIVCRPRWSRGNVLASRSKVSRFKPHWGRWIFSGRKNPEHKSSEAEISGSLKNLKPVKIGLWAKFNRHIHVLIPKFGGAQ